MKEKNTLEKTPATDLTPEETDLNLTRMLGAIDEYVGLKVRIRRNLLGLTQDQLAKKLDISFQQVQKYEKGLNRISGARIWQMARVLHIPIAYFFDGVERQLKIKEIKFDRYTSEMTQKEPVSTPPMTTEQSARMSTLMDAFARIKNPMIAQSIVSLVEAISANPDATQNPNASASKMTPDSDSAAPSDTKKTTR